MNDKNLEKRIVNAFVKMENMVKSDPRYVFTAREVYHLVQDNRFQLGGVKYDLYINRYIDAMTKVEERKPYETPKSDMRYYGK